MQLIFTVIKLILSLSLILLAANLFTNAVEWAGKKLNLPEGCVGSVLAAVGTALPETLIPVIAILLGGGASHANEIGIGAILGAPFMLSTLAFLVSGLAVWSFAKRGERPDRVQVDHQIFLRDTTFFLTVYSLALLASLAPLAGKYLVAVILIGAYLFYVYRSATVTPPGGKEICSVEDLHRLMFDRNREVPRGLRVGLQLAVSLAVMVIGAKIFVGSIEAVSGRLGISALVLSLIIAPIATELPEKFNSVIWIRQGKDTLALGNITGAMVFQSSVVPAVGIMLTPWALGKVELVTGLLTVLSVGMVLMSYRFRGFLSSGALMFGGVFYVFFLVYIGYAIGYAR